MPARAAIRVNQYYVRLFGKIDNLMREDHSYSFRLSAAGGRANRGVFGVLALFAETGRAAAGEQPELHQELFCHGGCHNSGRRIARRCGAGHNQGLATGTITVSGVPCTAGSPAAIAPCTTAGAVQADIVAAYLYWETEETAAKPADWGQGSSTASQLCRLRARQPQ